MVLHGENGSGKTNLLEAVYVLASLRSFRDARPARWVREGAAATVIEGQVLGATGARALSYKQVDGERVLSMDGGLASLNAWFDTLRAILFCPEQVNVIRGEPEGRRRLLDRAVFTARPAFLDLARDYKRVVAQRGALLRSGRPPGPELETWDERLVNLGAAVMLRRHELVGELRAPLKSAVKLISGGETVDLRLRSAGGEEDGEEAVRRRLREALVKARADELRVGSVLVGPHRDDLEIMIDGRSARRFASQGQARTVALALKLGELEAARIRGQSPLFLLDDLTSELDVGRRGRLLSHLLSLESQVWVTTTEASYLGPLPEAAARRFRITADAVLREAHPSAPEAESGGAESPDQLGPKSA